MNARDCAILAFKLVGLWFAAIGVVSFGGMPVVWQQFAREASFAGVATLASAVPGTMSLVMGALIWMNAERLATHVFGHDPAMIAARVFGEEADAAPRKPVALQAHPLFALALAVIGVLLVVEAVPQLVYSLAIFVRSRQAGGILGPDPTRSALLWDANAQGHLAAAATRLLIGLALLAGPTRLAAIYGRVRKDMRGTLADEARADASPPAPPADPPRVAS